MNAITSINIRILLEILMESEGRVILLLPISVIKMIIANNKGREAVKV